MKICSKCETSKLESEFAVKSGDKLQSYCKSCNRAYQNEHYRRNQPEYRQARRDRRSEVRSKISEAKLVPCMDCKVSYPYYVMQFDHLEAKMFNISGSCDYGWERIQEEIDKCEVVCANCHAARTHLRRTQPAE